MDFIIMIFTGLFALFAIVQGIDALVFGRTVETERERKRKAKAKASLIALEEAGGFDAVRKMNEERKRKEEEEDKRLTKLYGPKVRDDNGYSAIPRYKHRGPSNKTMRH